MMKNDCFIFTIIVTKYDAGGEVESGSEISKCLW